jgi:TolA-binding protein
MLKPSVFAGVVVLGLAVLVGSGASQEKKAKTPLPAGFKALNLTAAQEDKVREVTSEYKMRIDDLTKKLKELQAERLRAQMAVLTEEQRELYIKNKTGEVAKKKEEKKKKE